MRHQPAAAESTSAERLPWGALFVLILGTFMGVLDGSIVNVALPRMMNIFNVSTDHIQWVLTIYMLVGGMVIPASGYLADRFGYKTVYLGSLALFTVTSMLCGMSWSANSIILARGFQAIGGGMVMPISMAYVYRIWPKEKIGMALGIWGLTMMVAPTIGPTLGGYLVDYFSWRLIFYINLPVGLFTVLLGLALLKETPRLSGLKLDYIGLVLVSGACFAVLFALSKGQGWGWTAQSTATLFVLGFFCFVLFFFWELHVPQPVMDVRLLRNSTYLLSLAASSMASIALFTGIFIVPMFTQSVQGYSPMQTGLILMPAALVAGGLMPLAGKLFDKLGAAILASCGLALVGVMTYVLHNITADMPVRDLQLLLCLRSVGLGFSMMPLMTAGMNTIPGPIVAQASAMMSVVRQVAASFGIALVTYVLVDRTAFHTERLSEAIGLLEPLGYYHYNQVVAGVSGMIGPTAANGTTPGVLAGMVHKQAAVLAVGDAFVIAAVLAVAAIPLVFGLTHGRIEAARKREEERFIAIQRGGGSIHPVGVTEQSH
ncbi:MAG: DHA2 family efflux MFS transporter permease subunit [Ammonifex sp.]|nr:MAG: DHA2 family efflux MFS transporter permease subunit [Ammonifex sp.]